MSLILSILGVLKGIPGLLNLCVAIEKSINEAQARNRLEEKNRLVDAVIAAGLRNSREAGERAEVNKQTGLDSGGGSISGVVPGCAEDDKPTRI